LTARKRISLPKISLNLFSERNSYGVAMISRLLEIIGLFAKEPYKRDYVLQNRPMVLKSLLIVAAP